MGLLYMVYLWKEHVGAGEIFISPEGGFFSTSQSFQPLCRHLKYMKNDFSGKLKKSKNRNQKFYSMKCHESC